MKIPKTFQLAGTVWTVNEVTGIFELGHCDRDSAIIRIQSGLAKQIKESTFCHELQHAIRFAAGQTEHDEREIDAHGNLLHQYLNSCK